MNITYIDVIVFVTAFLLALYYYAMKPYKHFNNTDVKFVKDNLPFMGSMYPILTRKKNFFEFFDELYRKYPDEKYVGMFETKKPVLLLRDLEIIKKIGIKDIDNFHDHYNPINIENELLCDTLFNMKGEKWREMRASLSPAFTISKIKNMFPFINKCAEEMSDFIQQEKDIVENGEIEIEFKDLLSRYANDVIASSVFGCEVNSLKEKDNIFYKMGKLASDFVGIQMIKIIGFFVCPSIMNFFNIKFTRPETTNFFTKLVTETIKDRENSGLVRQDMMHLLMLAKQGSLKHDDSGKDDKDFGFAIVEESSIGKRQIKRKWEENELVAQAHLFFVAGFDTSSTAMVFFFYEMMTNPDAQKKIQNEIDDFLEKSNGNITYDDIRKLKYLDMAISESLRMWPPINSVDRVCEKSYTLPPPNESSTKSYEIRKGEIVWIPNFSIMRDPKYFPNPEKFDPERFSDENKDSINPTTYLPFGIGPRNCIGSRFALLEFKLCVFHILSKFDVIASNKSVIPMKLSKASVLLLPENGMWASLKLRNKK